MKIDYNDIPMRLLEMHAYERVAVYDPSNTDLLYLTHRLNVSVAVYPEGYPVALSQDEIPNRVEDELLSRDDRPRVGPAGFVGKRHDLPEYDGPSSETFPRPGVQPAFVTDKVVAYRLNQPRKKLKVSAHHRLDGTDMVWLESPRPGFKVDAVNGPHVLVTSPGAPSGEGVELVLNLQIETSLPPVDPASERAILSHRWKTEMGHDEHYYPTRTVRGTVVFNGSVVEKYGYDVDLLRNQLFHPIPLGYRRALGPVQFDEGQLVMTYEFSDTMVECVFDPANTGAVQMEIVEDLEYLSPLVLSDVIGDGMLWGWGGILEFAAGQAYKGNRK